MLSQPPTSGKAVLHQLEEQVRGDFFPKDKKNARIQLARNLTKPRDSLVRNFAIILLKIVTDPDERQNVRSRAAAAFNAVRDIYPQHSNQVLVEKFSDRLRSPTIKDDFLLVALTALAQIEEGEENIETDVRDRLLSFVKQISNETFPSIVAEALRVRFTSETAIQRAAKLEYASFINAVRAAPELNRESLVRNQAIDMYKVSHTYDIANKIGKQIILPMSQSFDQQEIEKIVNLAFTNEQVRFSHELLPVLHGLKLNSYVSEIWWDPLLSAMNDNEFLFPLFFKAPMAIARRSPNLDLDENL